jgi:hypothetical protein
MQPVLNTQEILSCRTGALRGRRVLRTFLKLRVALPLVEMRILVSTNGRSTEACTANNPR